MSLGYCLVCVCILKAHSHGAIFLFVTAMQKMDCVDVNEGVHMVQFHVRVMHWCVRHCTIRFHTHSVQL